MGVLIAVCFVVCYLMFILVLQSSESRLLCLIGLPGGSRLLCGSSFLAMPWVCLRFVIVVFLDHTHLLF